MILQIASANCQSNLTANFLLQGAAEITPTFGGVTARAVEGVQ